MSANQQATPSSQVQLVEPDTPKCVEHGIWTPLPTAPPKRLQAFTLRLRDVSPRAHERIKAAGAMTFHTVGCTGAYDDHAPQLAVARAMIAQTRGPGPSDPIGLPLDAGRRPAFLYHLGDVVYKDDDAQDAEGDDQPVLYEQQYDVPYAGYARPIFAIAGNHDGKQSPHLEKSAIDHFIGHFCVQRAKPARYRHAQGRPAMSQPYPYWRLTTPVAHIIGLYSNIANGGVLDDPANPNDHRQYRWLVDQLKDVRRKNAGRLARKALLLMVHYPPYSGATNFAQRGDPTLGPSHAAAAHPLGAVLQQAFAESGQRPDAVFSAHAHLYQRLTYRYADGWEIPFLVVGCGGHGPIERLGETCAGSLRRLRKPPFDAVLPPGLALPDGDRVQVNAYNDRSFGFMRVTVTRDWLAGDFFTVQGDAVTLSDSFRLGLTAHRIDPPDSSAG